jgi:uncharacterized membrane protein
VPDIGHFHPQIVHFVIALLAVGVLARAVSLLPLPARLTFIGPAAAMLILFGTLASVFAVVSGKDNDTPSERIPGVRPAVAVHEEWGERTRNVFLVIAALEISALALGARRSARGVRVASAVLGLVGLAVLYETGEHGGDLVYSYAGGVGTRSGDTTDIRRLLVAGLYYGAVQDRGAGRLEQAGQLVRELGRRMPADTNVRFLLIESTLLDAKNPAGALAALDSFTVAPTDRRNFLWAVQLRADALAASGRKDSARAVIQELIARYGENPRLTQQLQRLK